MLKMVGSCIVILTAAYIGAGIAGILRRRVTVLREFQTALELMEREMNYTGTAMPELLELLANRIEAPDGSFFRRCGGKLDRLDQHGFGAVWRGELAGSELLLKDEEREVIERLGDVLGRYDGEGQCAAIARVRLELADQQRKAEEDRQRLSRVYQAVILGAGVMLVILLL